MAIHLQLETFSRLRLFGGVFVAILFMACSTFGQFEAVVSETTSDAAIEISVVTWSDDRPFAIVELFTSEGCSSCPPADKNLQSIVELARNKKQSIYALSFHVDYWNYIGWTDPFSLEAATHRQRLYAGVHKSEQVYTPQMVVNGTTEFLGSNRDKSQRAIAAALKVKPSARVGIAYQKQAEGVSVQWQTERADVGDLLVVALVQATGQRNVDAGENAGRKLSHSNIVREFRVADASADSGKMDFTLPAAAITSDSTSTDAEGSLQLVAFIQTDAAAMRAAVVLPVKAGES